MNAKARVENLSAEIAVKYGVKGSLEKQVRKIGRAFPKYERKQAQILVHASHALGHPKMQKQLDERSFERAETALLMHLEKVDAMDRRKGIALDLTTTVLVNVVLAVIILATLWAWLKT